MHIIKSGIICFFCFSGRLSLLLCQQAAHLFLRSRCTRHAQQWRSFDGRARLVPYNEKKI
jgi:hypothetical protein